MSKSQVQLTHSDSIEGLPKDVLWLAESLAARHGRLLISREKNGLHMNMACPKCLEAEGEIELRKRHLAVNADKFFSTGKWAGQPNRDAVGKCMKCGAVFKMTQLQKYASLEQRGITTHGRNGIVFADNTPWLRTLADGTTVPGGPGVDGDMVGIVPITSLHPTHPARWYLESRGFNVAQLYEHMRVSYCALEWQENREQKRFMRHLAGGFRDSHQGRIVFFADMAGRQTGYQSRVIEQELLQNGVRSKAFWNGYSNAWQVMEVFDPAKEKFVLAPGLVGEWGISKYRTANGSHRNELLMGLDAAVRWNKTFRPGRPPVAFVPEGPLDAAALGLMAVARIGKFLSEPQVDVLARHFAHVWLVRDHDKAGRDSADDIARVATRLSVDDFIFPETVDGRKIKDVAELPHQIRHQLVQQALESL